MDYMDPMSSVLKKADKLDLSLSLFEKKLMHYKLDIVYMV